MNTLEAIAGRHSVRHYVPTPVAKETVEQLLTAAVQAPSAMNSQPWAFGVIQDLAALQTLSDTCKATMLEHLDEFSPMAKYRENLEDPNYNIFYGAPCLIVIYAKPNGPQPQMDCCLAAENVLLAAHDLGLGSCWIGFAWFYLRTPEANQALGIPAEYQCVAPLIVGYPAGPTTPPEKNPPEMLFWN